MLASLFALTLIVGVVPAMDANAASDSGLSKDQVIAKVKEAKDNLIVVKNDPGFPSDLKGLTLSELMIELHYTIDSIFEDYDDDFKENPSKPGEYQFIYDPTDPEIIYVNIVNGVVESVNLDDGWIFEYQHPTPESEPTPVPETTPTPKTTSVKSAKTGEYSNMTFIALILAMGTVGLGYITKKKA